MALPFEPSSFDVVLSVESSHCYPDFNGFAREVARTLRPGGLFLLADFRDAGSESEQLQRSLRSLEPCWQVVHAAEITRNVVAALDLDHERKARDCLGLVPALLRGFVEMFIGTKGSKTYRNFCEGHWLYHYYVLRKAEA